MFTTICGMHYEPMLGFCAFFFFMPVHWRESSLQPQERGFQCA